MISTVLAQVPDAVGLNNENLVQGFGPAGAVVIGILLAAIGMMSVAISALYKRIKEKDAAWENLSQDILKNASAQAAATVQIAEKMESMTKIIEQVSMKMDDLRINKSGCKQ